MKETQAYRGEGSKINLEQKPGAAEPCGPCKDSRFSYVRALLTISVEIRSRVGEDHKNIKLWAFVSAHSFKKNPYKTNKKCVCFDYRAHSSQGSQRISQNSAF